MSFEISLQHLLEWEGGFGDNPHDAGGATNLGVIQDEYDRFRDRKGLPRQSVRNISHDEATEIYKIEYWDATRCGDLDQGVANCLFDGDVNSGDRRGVRWLQEAINQLSGNEAISVDGACGPKTIAAAKGASPSPLIDEMLNFRLAFLHVARNSKTGEALWPTFGHGWQKRLDGVRAQSHALCGVVVPPHPLTPALAHIEKGKSMSDLSPLLGLARVVAPLLVPALESSNPLFGIAVGALATALQTSSQALPETASSIASTDPGKLAVALQTAEVELKAHLKAVSAMVPSAPTPDQAPATQASPVPAGGVMAGDPASANIFVDNAAAIGKYVLGMIAMAIMVRMGMTVDTANGVAANVVPVIWTALSGAMTAGMGWLLHRSIAGSNAVTAQLVKH